MDERGSADILLFDGFHFDCAAVAVCFDCSYRLLPFTTPRP